MKLLKLAVLVTACVAACSPFQAFANPYVNNRGEVNHKALRRACGGPPPFVAGLNTAKFAGEADVTPQAVAGILGKISDDLKEVDLGSVNLETVATLEKKQIGQIYGQVFTDVGEAYFCMLAEYYENEPDGAMRVEAIRQAESLYNTAVFELSLPTTYKNGTADIMSAVKTYKDQASAIPVVFRRRETLKVIDQYNYATVSRAQINAAATVSDGVTLKGCAGVVNASAAVVDDRVLGGLDRLAKNIDKMISGDPETVLRAVAMLGAELNGSKKEAQIFNAANMVCAKDVKAEVKDRVEADAEAARSGDKPEGGTTGEAKADKTSDAKGDGKTDEKDK